MAFPFRNFDVAQACLAHQHSDRTKKAYARSTLEQPRAKLMQQWADYLLPRPAGPEG